MQPVFEPNKPEYKAIFEACYALAKMAGTTLPNINTDASWQIHKKGCAAIVALQIAGIPTDAIIAQLLSRIDGIDVDVAKALVAALRAQTTADGAMRAAEDAQDTADAALAYALSATGFTAEDKDAITINPGMAVTPHPSGSGVKLASASSIATALVGLSRNTASLGFPCTFQVSDAITLADWTFATGSASLAPLGVYFLDLTAGKISLTPSFSNGNIIQIVGKALSPKTLKIEIQDPILL